VARLVDGQEMGWEFVDWIKLVQERGGMFAGFWRECLRSKKLGDYINMINCE
jgi:hypothetical protein